MSEQNTSGESWDGLLKNYLKAENLKEEEEKFACTNFHVDGKDMELSLQRGEEKFIYSLNTTNKVFLKKNGIAAPKDIIGKMITIKKVLATNPSTKQEVDSTRICKVE